MNDTEWAAGIPKSPHSRILSSWQLPPELRSSLERYYLLRWNAEYFWEKYTEGRGIILHQEIAYSVIFHQGDLPSQTGQVFLSFRKPLKFNMGFVLVNQAKYKKGPPNES